MNRLGRHLSISIAVGVVCLLVGESIWAQSTPLYERDPFDLLVLTQDAGGNRIPVFPLIDRSGKRGRDGVKLRIRMLAYPDREFDVDWKNIRTVVAFEDLLLQAANRLSSSGRLDEAYQHLHLLREQDPQRNDLAKAASKFMSAAAVSSAQQGKLVDAWGTLDFVLQADPDSKPALATLLEVADKLFIALLKEEEFGEARSMVERLQTRYGKQRVGRLTKRWNQRLRQLSDQYLNRAGQAGGDSRAAFVAVQQAVELWPDSTKAQKLATKLAKLHPRVMVGVSRASTEGSGYWNEWSSQRAQRLMVRKLTEIKGVDSNGARYDSPVGTLNVQQNGRIVTLNVASDQIAMTTAGLTSHDFSEVVMRSLQPESSTYFPLRQQLLTAIDVPSGSVVNFEHSRPVLRPAAMLTLPIRGAGRDRLWNRLAPYSRVAGVDENRYQRNESYVFQGERQPIEIVERYVGDGSLVSQLRRGSIHVADRLSALDAEELKTVRGVTVRRYGFPSVHFLLPNMDESAGRRLTADRNFRRALVYAINRRTILEQDLLRGRSVEGCQLISGPFAPGKGRDDPLAYAYDPEVTPREYDPTLGITLASLARREFSNALEKMGEEVPQEWPPLVLAHPADQLSRQAARAIASYLNGANLACVLRELPVGQVLPESGEPWDLLYVDTVMSEPILDVHRLFGQNGLLAGASPYFQAGMERLALTTAWSDARELLREIHRIAHEEVTVIPLWQWADYYAYRNYVQGLQRDAVTLYQNVEDWSVHPESGF